TIVWSPVPGYAPLKGLRVLVNNAYLNWDLPAFGRYGERSMGMFGLLPTHLAAKGCLPTALPVFDVKDLEAYHVIVLIKLQERFSEDDRGRILEFVKNGGGLLIAGDHTGSSTLREPVNHLVGGLGIELNFDSAKPLDFSARNAFTYLEHPVTRGLCWWFNDS